MSLPMDEDMIADEEYLDDPIQLIPQLDNLTRYPEPEEFTAYKQQTYVPVTFFNIERNIKLLNNCHPLSIKLIDCNQYPWYNKKFNNKYRHGSNNLQTYDSSSSENDDVVYTDNESETISMEAKSILNKISFNGLTIKVKTNKTKKVKKIKSVDYKKNKGLIGMKIFPRFEVIELDDDSDDSRIDNKNKEKETSSNVTADVNEMSADVMTPEIDWTIESSKKNELEVNLTVGFNPVSEITEPTKDITEAKRSDLSHASSIVVDVEKAVLGKISKVKVDEQKTINVKPTECTTVDNIKEGTMQLNDKDDVMRKKRENEEKHVSEVNPGLIKNTHETSTESTVNRATVSSYANENHVSVHSDIIITDSGTQIKEDNCSKSPVFPCAPSKKIKMFAKGRHDTSKLVIHHPKDFTDNKFKPNRLTKPKATNVLLIENVNLIQDNATECIKPTNSLSSLNSTTDVQGQNQKQIMRLNSDDKSIENQNKNDFNIRTEVQQVNTDQLSRQETSNQNENNLESKIGTVGKYNLQNLTRHESKNDKQCTDTSVAISKSQTYNKEQIIKLKLDENYIKINVIKKHKSLEVENLNEVQRDNVFDVTKGYSQTNKTDHLRSTKGGSSNQKYSKRPSVHIREKQPSSSHSIDTILAKSRPEDTSKMVSKNIFQKIGSGFSHEGTNNMSQGHANKWPQTLYKSRIRPFAGSISNYQSMYTNELAKNAAPISKNLNVGTSHQQHIMAQNLPSTSAQKPQQNTGTAIENNTTNLSARCQIAQTDHKETSERNDAIMLERNVSNSSQNANVSRKDGPKSVMQNVDPIVEQKRANFSYNGFTRHNPQNYCIPYFGPQPRQFVRPIMGENGTQVLSVTNYPRQMYYNTMNSVPINPYVGYTNNYNSYWPYQYTSMPPPPPPPPPISVPQNLQNNNVTHRSNLTDIDLNSTNPPKSINSAIVNNSQNVVSSKTEMFEVLEKEMMNIHNEDSGNLTNKQLYDSRPIDKDNNDKSDPRNKQFLNATDIAASQLLKKTTPVQPTNKVRTILFKPPREDYDSAKNSRNTMSSLKRPSDEIILKDNVKNKKNIISTPKLDKHNAAVRDSSIPGYSPPILPIPSFKQTLDILTRASNDAQKQLEAFAKSRKKCVKEDILKNRHSNFKKDKVKKISLDEYKKREDKRLCERKKRKYERKQNYETVKIGVEAKHSDQDQGYDSDSTIVL